MKRGGGVQGRLPDSISGSLVTEVRGVVLLKGLHHVASFQIESLVLLEPRVVCSVNHLDIGWVLREQLQ